MENGGCRMPDVIYSEFKVKGVDVGFKINSSCLLQIDY